MEDRRLDPPLTAPERETLTTFLDWQRETLAMKCWGLTADQLRARSVPTSDLTLLGLVRHMVEIERGWFRSVANGEDLKPVWGGKREDGSYAEFDVDDADPDEAFKVWEEECDRSRAVVASLDLDAVGVHRRKGDGYSLRWILTHMIEEYARHNGHADLLREAIDGVTGE